jgi:hypothetical protein
MLKEHNLAFLALHATTAISRASFNMDRFALVVDDRIAINIDIQARPGANQPIMRNNACAVSCSCDAGLRPIRTN